jgi:hypothetical protein
MSLIVRDCNGSHSLSTFFLFDIDASRVGRLRNHLLQDRVDLGLGEGGPGDQGSFHHSLYARVGGEELNRLLRRMFQNDLLGLEKL